MREYSATVLLVVSGAALTAVAAAYWFITSAMQALDVALGAAAGMM